jgi:hypothetical protein
MSLLGWFRRIKRLIILDPVHKCEVHKQIGCSHVDGILCDFPQCSMRRAFVKRKG